MSSGRRQPHAGGWLEQVLPTGTQRPRKRELAEAIRSLLRQLNAEESAESADRPPTQAEVAKRLDCDPTSLSRYARLDPRVPDPAFIEDLYRNACSDAAVNGVEVGITLGALQTLRMLAEAETRGRCPLCLDLSKRIDSLNGQLNTPCPSCESLRVTLQREREEAAVRMTALRESEAAMRAAVQKAQQAEAGLQARLAKALSRRTPLPVPHQMGDRQRSRKDWEVARQLAVRAAELDNAGKEDSALNLLRLGTTELLSPCETALVMMELRQQEHDRLIDNLIHVYGRDQGDRHVIEVAFELHAEGAVEDAGAVLQAALR